MTDPRTPLDAALDLMLFAPVGLALTIGEELPKLAAKGRSTLTSRVTTARVVGQFAVAQGRRQVERRLQPQAGPTPAAAPARAAAPPDPAPAPGGSASAPGAPPASPGRGVIGGAVGAPPAGAGRNGDGPVDAAPVADTGPVGAVPEVGAAAGRQTSPSDGSADLAIPGYDSLSASQVVQRLAGLSAIELGAVKAYEAANRGRRTVLARIGQLQG